MVLAVSSMSPAVQAVVFAVAFALFALCAVIRATHDGDPLVPAGLALVTFVAFWNALAAA